MNITDIRDYIKEHGSLKIAYVPDVVDEISFFHIVLEDDQEFKLYNIFFNKQDDEYVDFLKFVIEKFVVNKQFIAYIKKLCQNLYQKQFKKEFQISNKDNFELEILKEDLKVELDDDDLITNNLLTSSKKLTEEEIEKKQKLREKKEMLKTSHPKICTRFISCSKNKKSYEHWCVKFFENGKYKSKALSKNVHSFEDAVKFYELHNDR